MARQLSNGQVDLSNPRSIVEAGERVWREKYKAQYEPCCSGKFVVIDVQSERAYLGNTAPEALLAAQKESAPGALHLIRIGALGAFRM